MDPGAPTETPAGGQGPAGARRERVVAVASVASVAPTALVMVWHGPWHEPGWWMTAPFVVVWCCVPYAWVARTLREGRQHEPGARLATFGAALVVGIAAWVLWHYHNVPGARGGRVFLMLPIWQGLAFAPLALLARWLRPGG